MRREEQEGGSMIESRTMALPLLHGKTVLITGAAHRIGRSLALTCAHAGGNVIIHYHTSQTDAQSLQEEIATLGRKAWCLRADLQDPQETAGLMDAAAALSPLFALVNNASIFENLSLQQTRLEDWERHLTMNLTAPFLLSQSFARHLQTEGGCIVNLLDWRALRPGADHFPYTVSKAALAALTESLAAALAPRITVNGLALGAILPPSGGGNLDGIIEKVPARRWGGLEDVGSALLFLLTGAPYVTGEIIHVDGGRHLV